MKGINIYTSLKSLLKKKNMQWEGSDTFTGSVRTSESSGIHPEICRPASLGLKVNLKMEPEGSATGSSSSASQVNYHYSPPRTFSPTPISSPPGLQRQKLMYGKKKQELKAPSLNLDESPSIRRSRLIGKWFGMPPRLGTWKEFPLELEYVVTGM